MEWIVLILFGVFAIYVLVGTLADRSIKKSESETVDRLLKENRVAEYKNRNKVARRPDGSYIPKSSIANRDDAYDYLNPANPLSSKNVSSMTSWDSGSYESEKLNPAQHKHDHDNIDYGSSNHSSSSDYHRSYDSGGISGSSGGSDYGGGSDSSSNSGGDSGSSF